jgi:membrane protein implicated in regulation of membrane protease activity
MSVPSSDPPRRTRRPQSPAQRFVRVWLPIVIVASGLLLALIGHTDAAYEGGALLISAGVSVWLLNAFFRIGVRGDEERDDELAAREEFERTGRWPDETPQ